MKEEMRVLQIIGSMGLGGAETMIMNMYRNIDRKKLQFDFFLIDENIHYYEKEIVELGGIIYKTKKRSEDIIKHYIDLYKVIKYKKYDVVQLHINNAAILLLSIIVVKLAGASRIYTFAHSTMDWRSWRAKFLHFIFRPITNKLITKKLSCGNDASKWLYGEMNKQNVKVISPPVNCENFLFDEEKYNKYRQELGVENQKVYIHVGRFMKVKNHKFLIDIFKEIVNYEPESKLFLIGNGDLEEEVKEYCKMNGIYDKVIFFGNIDDVYNKFIASDIMIFPSLYEGFPTVLIEAQASGLNCFVSDSITKKIGITDLITFISLEKPPKKWAKIILDSNNYNKKRKAYNSIIAENYDVKLIANEISKIYLEENINEKNSFCNK